MGGVAHEERAPVAEALGHLGREGERPDGLDPRPQVGDAGREADAPGHGLAAAADEPPELGPADGAVQPPVARAAGTRAPAAAGRVMS